MTVSGLSKSYSIDSEGKVFRNDFHCWKCYQIAKPHRYDTLHGMQWARAYKCDVCKSVSTLRPE